MASITRLVRSETAFDPETVAVLAAAFDEAWSWLQTSGSECARPAYARAMREVVARRIFEMAKQGIKDRKELADRAVGFLAANYRHSVAGRREASVDV
jgi:dihydropteroate synthase